MDAPEYFAHVAAARNFQLITQADLLRGGELSLQNFNLTPEHIFVKRFQRGAGSVFLDHRESNCTVVLVGHASFFSTAATHIFLMAGQDVFSTFFYVPRHE